MEFPVWAPSSLVKTYIYGDELSKCKKCGNRKCTVCGKCKKCGTCQGCPEIEDDHAVAYWWLKHLYRLLTNPDMERAWEEVEKRRLKNEIFRKHNDRFRKDRFYDRLFSEIDWSMEQTKRSVDQKGCITPNGEEEDNYRTVRDLCSELTDAIKKTDIDKPATYYFSEELFDSIINCFDPKSDWLNRGVLGSPGSKLSDVLFEVRQEAIGKLQKVKQRKSVIERKTKPLTFFIRTFFPYWKKIVGGVMPGTLAAFCRAIFDDANIDKGTIEAALKNYPPD